MRRLSFAVCALLLWSHPASAEPARSTASAVAPVIETVGFITQARMGYGGMIMPVLVPVALFKDGRALKDMEALNAPEGLAAHRAKNPDDWTSWRRAGGVIQILGDEGWKPLPFTKTMGPLPKGYTLYGRFRAMSGAGTLAIGGTSAVVAWTEMTFAPDGTFISGGGAGASTQSGGTAVTTGGARSDRAGTYAIDGYVMTLAFRDGRSERRLIVYDPSDPKSALWIDGDGYVRR